jgi:hypothetical protein
MIDTTGWTYLYKTVNGNKECTTNLLYTPLLNHDKTILCMLWDAKSEYQKDRELTDELVDFFFEREISNLINFQGRPWAPKLIGFSKSSKQVFIEWNNKSLNQIIFDDNNLDELCPDWKEQISVILTDIVSLGYYKMALYPHCFYLDSNNKIKTFDFYSCIESSYPFLSRDKIAGMIGPDSGGRFDEATDNGMVNFEFFFKRTISNHLEKSWPDNPFPEIYKRLYD